MWTQINGKFLDKVRETAKKTAIDNIGEESQKEEDSLVWEDLETAIDTLEISEDEISISVSNALGYFSIDVPLDSGTLEEILAVTIKKMNKLKSLIENLK